MQTMTLVSFLTRSENMSGKVHVITLRKRRDEDEVTERRSEIYRKDVACLYKDRNGVFIVNKSGLMIKVKHSLKELYPYFFGDLTPHERLS